ncbi:MULTISPECIES: hypothetical protein [Paenibacillus]|uniref:PqqD family protein n=1 Tax=Paenibacillus cucumis (ex Kampfer et al. 2016) TaxID=1776858 RepID=A0ABS7KSG4_9BACL|nr:hypothetical protein [Paenibacillus cucumis (ex Kampfer et al. 2016)]MBY0207109.1 hypothetical protein [Paenibacillus cucumis (ex Kampfer et al. 2016)]MDP9698991.1 hypothetical protein [Paenibacillus intestini]
MRVKLNPEYTIKEFKDGKLIVNLVTSFSFYINDAVYSVIKPLINESSDVQTLTKNVEYDPNEVMELIKDLISKDLLVVIDE